MYGLKNMCRTITMKTQDYFPNHEFIIHNVPRPNIEITRVAKTKK